MISNNFPFTTSQSRYYSNDPTSSRNNSKAGTGLFSIPGLHEPSDFFKLAHNAIHTCNDLRQQIHNSLQTNNLSPRETLYILDSISNTICSIIDASELCRSVHKSPSWRQAATNAYTLLSEYIADLNTDEALYQSLLPITSNPDIMNNVLEEEERRMAILLQKEYERDGIHLPKGKREDVKELHGFITQLETLFSENLIKNEIYDVHNTTADGHGHGHGMDVVDGVKQIIPHHILMDIQQKNQSPQRYQSAFENGNNHDQSSIQLSTEPHITNTILRHSQSPQLRQQVFMKTNTTCTQNLDILDALINRRHELAKTIGYDSYAHYFTSDKMAQSPGQVNSFLKSVGKACEKQYFRDMDLLLSVKKQVEGPVGIDGGLQLEAWDMNFYNGLLKAHMLQNDDDDGDSQHTSLSYYFTVEQSLNGMKLLVHKLFGIVMEEVKTRPEEQWDIENSGDQNGNGNASLIRKFDFYKEDDGTSLGTIYFDLHPREGKYAHAAHFTIRCGCETKSHDISNTNSSSSSTSKYQSPIVAVVCNLSPPQPTQTKTSLISHSEVETLFHEFGHALHSLLSRTKFQHLSGTRAAMDFVETPSHLMEFFVWNEEFLNIIGRHYITGEPIPPKHLKNLVQSRNLLKAVEVRTQVVYALFDQMIFGPPDLWRKEGGAMSTTDAFAALHREYNIPYADGTHWHSRFGHLVTYGAGYYSYLYASIFSADLWNTCFAGGAKAFSRDAGISYWNEILIHGGAKDPNLMLRTMLGRDPKADEFFKFR